MKGENQQQTQPTYGVNARIWTRVTLVGGECSYHRATLGCIRFLSTGREWGGEGRARATPMRLCANISVAIAVQQYPLTYSCQSRLPSHTFTAISRKVVGKNVHATIPKGNMRYDQYTVPGTVTVKNSFFAFLSTRKHTSMASRAILSNFCEELRTQNHPQSLSGLSRALFPTTFPRSSCIQLLKLPTEWKIISIMNSLET